MKTKTTETLPSIHRRRLSDASGLFWSLLIVLFGCVYAVMYFGENHLIIGVIVVVGMVPGVLWQFHIWKLDSAINRKSTEWCRRYYPESGGFPIVDLVVAMAHVLAFDFAALTPSSLLVDLAGPPDGTDESPPVELSEMLQRIAHEARIRNVKWSSFSGTTVDDAVKFLIQSNTKDVTTKR